MLARSIRCAPQRIPRRSCSGGILTLRWIHVKPLYIPRRFCSGSPDATVSLYIKGKTWVESTTLFKFFNNIYVARLLRISRVLALCYGVYFCGKQDGQAEYALDEKGMQKQLREALVYNFAKSKIITQKETTDYHKHNDRAIKICRRIINATHDEMDKSVALKKNRLLAVTSQLFKSSASDERQELQAEAERLRVSISGMSNTLDTMFRGQHWTVFITDSRIPNAYVSNMCPRSIFIHVGLLQRASDDELALVVGHELAHLILHHTETRNLWAFRLSTITMIVMVLVDPTGFYSNLFDNALLRLSSFVQRRIGHDQENEADELGVKIAHAACYDVRKGQMFLRKIERWTQEAMVHEEERYAAAIDTENTRRGYDVAKMVTHTTSGSTAAVYDAGWNQTHPSHDFREAHISAIINMLPKNTHCGSMKFQLQRASDYLQRMQHYHN